MNVPLEGRSMVCQIAKSQFKKSLVNVRVTVTTDGCIICRHWVGIFLRAKAAMLSARLSHRNFVRLSVCPSVCHTGGSGKNDPS